MSVYFLTPNGGSGGDTITHGDDDDMSLALGRSIVDQVSGSHPLGTADAVAKGLILPKSTTPTGMQSNPDLS
jgi:hypothetical protein